MTKPAHPNSRERIADPEERAAADALANRRLVNFEKHWRSIIPQDLIDVGLAYAAWVERGQPVTSGMGQVRGGGDSERRFIEYDLMRRMEAAVVFEFGTLGHFILNGATVHGLTAKEMVAARLVYVTREEMMALGAEPSKQRLDAVKSRWVTGMLEKALQVCADVKNGRL